MKEQILKEFWLKLRKNIMWRDSESGIVERHITELINEIIDQTREETIREVKREVKKYVSSKKKILHFNRIIAGEEILDILNKLKK